MTSFPPPNLPRVPIFNQLNYLTDTFVKTSFLLSQGYYKQNTPLSPLYLIARDTDPIVPNVNTLFIYGEDDMTNYLARFWRNSSLIGTYKGQLNIERVRAEGGYELTWARIESQFPAGAEFHCLDSLGAKIYQAFDYNASGIRTGLLGTRFKTIIFGTTGYCASMSATLGAKTTLTHTIGVTMPSVNYRVIATAYTDIATNSAVIVSIYAKTTTTFTLVFVNVGGVATDARAEFIIISA